MSFDLSTKNKIREHLKDKNVKFINIQIGIGYYKKVKDYIVIFNNENIRKTTITTVKNHQIVGFGVFDEEADIDSKYEIFVYGVCNKKGLKCTVVNSLDDFLYGIGEYCFTSEFF
jgi:hypothetical protein